MTKVCRKQHVGGIFRIASWCNWQPLRQSYQLDFTPHFGSWKLSVAVAVDI